MIKIGRGWAPIQKQDDVSAIAIRELQKLLRNLFDSKKTIRIRGRYDY